MNTDDRVERARQLYEEFVFGGDPDLLAAADRELDGAEAGLVLARGRIAHGRFLRQYYAGTGEPEADPRELTWFERAAELYQAAGDQAGQAQALFWLGCFHQLVRGDNDTAVPYLARSLDLAALTGDQATASDALRHLGIADHRAGRLDAARDRLEESTRIRREIGLTPGVAANLVGLAYVAAGQGRRDDAVALAAEAAAIAQASGAQVVLGQAQEAHAAVSGAAE